MREPKPGSIEALCAPLADLYEKTGDDWVLQINYDLTEPTCPAVVVRRLGSNSVRYRVDRDTIEEGVRAAVDLCYREQVRGEKITPECPFTNPDDHTDPR